MDVLRGYLNAGLDLKRQGILSEEKLAALQAHQPTTEIQALADDKETTDQPADQSDYVDLLARIKACTTKAQLIDLCNAEDDLFMVDAATALGKAVAEKMQQFKDA
jgi:hypothetical protein